MARNRNAAAALRAAAESMEEEDGQIVEGAVVTDVERDADRIEQEDRDDILHALTVLEGAGDAIWKVERVLPAEKAGWCMDIPTAQLSQSYIKRKCGPGKYRVRGWAKGHYVGGRTFNIAETADDNHALVPAGTAPNFEEFFLRLEAQKGAWKDELKFWAGLLTPILAPAILAWIQSGRNKGNSLTDMVTALQGLRSLSDPADPLKQVSQIRDLIGAVKDLTPEASTTGSTWVDLIRDGVKELGPVAAQLMASKGAAGTATPGIEAPATRPQNNGDPMLMLLNWLRPQMVFLVSKAARNADPGLYADWLADNVPPNLAPATIETFLKRQDWWQLLVQFAPAASPYQGWFNQLRDALLQIIEEAKQENAPQNLPDPERS